MGAFEFGSYVVTIADGACIAAKDGVIIAEAETENELLNSLKSSFHQGNGVLREPSFPILKV